MALVVKEENLENPKWEDLKIGALVILRGNEDEEHLVIKTRCDNEPTALDLNDFSVWELDYSQFTSRIIKVLPKGTELIIQ